MKTILQPETMAAIAKLDNNCVDAQSMRLGFNGGEPLILALDGLLRYAKAYQQRFESRLADDGVLGQYWLEALRGIHGLLNGDGAVAMERNITTDSKSNGVCEDIYCAALAVAGLDANGDAKESEAV